MNRERPHSPLRQAVFPTLVGWLLGLGAAATLMGQPPQAKPDLLGLRRLMQSEWMRASEDDEGRPAAKFDRGAFLMPVADEVDRLLQVDESVRLDALAWCDAFSPSQVLFRPSDLRGLRQRLSTLPAAAVNRWSQSSQALREDLDSDSWRETQRWLADFLAVQAYYPAAELESFRLRMASRTPRELREIVAHFQSIRLARAARQQVSEQQRRQALANVQQLRAAQNPGRASTIPTQQPLFPSINGPTPIVPLSARTPLVYRQRSLSQRVSDLYILRGIYGGNFVWWLP